MNELSKLFSSALMLLAGFAAASLFGPPEVVDRLSQLVRPSSPAPGSLAPLPAPAAAPETMAEMPTAWPALGQPAAPQPGPAPIDATAQESFAQVSWPSEPAPQAEQPSAAAETPAAQAGASDADAWLTAANLWTVGATAAPAEQGERRLEPVRRRGAVADVPPPAPATVQDAVATPQADWNAAPATSFAANPPAPSPAPSLDDSPYGKRPTFASQAPAGWDTPTLDDAPHRLATLKPVERRSAPSTSVTQHVVTDGDTLASLAERYLGDAARAQEVFELNNDRLEHPDLLPIGMVLRVPGGVSDAKFAGAANTPDAFPPLQPQSAFSTVSSAGGTSLPGGAAPRRPLQPVDQAFDRPLTDEQRLGPIDPLYSSEFQWEAARGW